MASSASEHGFRPQLVKIALGPADKKQERVDAIVFLQGLTFINVLSHFGISLRPDIRQRSLFL